VVKNNSNCFDGIGNFSTQLSLQEKIR